MVKDIINVDITDQRYAVLTFEQVKRLDIVLQGSIPIHGRGNFPTLEIKLKDFVSTVKTKLDSASVSVNDIRLNGSAASFILATKEQPYNDVDLIFSVDLKSPKDYDRVKTAVLESLLDFLPEGVSRKRMSTDSMKEGYVNKMVKVHDSDKWSLISLSNQGGRNLELKFVDTMRRQFEFSVDSFQISLESLFFFYGCAEMPMNPNFYPTVVGDSVYGNFSEALYHLRSKLIATKHPEEIRGGGLLKYCNLLAKGYEPAYPNKIKALQRYMCSRFFIDFPDTSQQLSKLESYLCNHFIGDDESLRVKYLMILHKVVDESTVCLMGHERRQILNLINDLAYQVYCIEMQANSEPSRACSSPAGSCCSSNSSSSSASTYEVRVGPSPPPVIYSNGYYYAPIAPLPQASYSHCRCGWVSCA